MNRILIIVIALGVVAARGGVAHAYPQYQLDKDQTCTGCHLSPSGGGLLTENGMATAEGFSQYGTAPEFFYDKVKTPSWLELGGDFRGAAGYLRAPDQSATAFPMQAEVYAHATFGAFSLQLTGGVRDPQNGNEASTLFWSREHYLMWESNPGGTEGWYVRVGRFMPVFGLRFAEHDDYTRRYGGVPLYGETYGAAIEVVRPIYEAHLTGFIKDPLIDTTLHSNGFAFYGEVRPMPFLSFGAETMYQLSDDDRNFRVGATSKLYVEKADLLFQGELQLDNQLVLNSEGAHTHQLVAYVMASKFLGKATMIDFGYGNYNEDYLTPGLDRQAFDINVHWFTTSHLELVLLNRLEVLDGPNGAYSLLMVHYRL